MNLKLKQSEIISEQLEQLLASTTWGGNGAQYTHGGKDVTLREMQGQQVLELYDKEKIVAGSVFSSRQLGFGNKQQTAVYTRYFSTSPAYRGKGILSKFGVDAFDKVFADAAAPTLFYNLVEANNAASKSIVEKAGFTPWREIRTLGISRFNPKKHPNVFDVCPCESVETKEWLSEVYQDHGFVHFDHLFKEIPYYVYRVKGEVLAGVQAVPCTWEIKKLPGLSGRLFKSVLPFIPILNKVFNPKKFQFLGLEAIYFKDGHEDKLYKVLETIMAKQKVFAAMSFMDAESGFYKTLQSTKQNGVLNAFCKDNKAFLMAKSKGLSTEDEQAMRSRPSYFSAYDTV